MPIKSNFSIAAADSDFCTERITLYKYITPVALAGLIQHGDIKLTLRKDANDPFECLPEGKLPLMETLADIGVLSLTKKCSNHPMWGNYADKYRGACIEFGVDYFSLPENKEPSNKGEELAQFGQKLKKLGTEVFFYQLKKGKNPDFQGCEIIQKCEYGTERSNPMNWCITNTPEEFIRGLQQWFRQINTKHDDWAYEEEYRVSMRRNSCSRFSVGSPTMYFTNAFTRYITKIILGPKCDYSPREVDFLISKRREQMKERLYIPRGVKVVKARIQECSFDLDIPDDEYLTKN